MTDAMMTEALGPVAAALVKIQRKEIDTLRAQNGRMLELLRECSKWYVGEMPDGTGRRDAIDAMIAELT